MCLRCCRTGLRLTPSFSGYDDDYDDALLDDHLMLWDSIQSSRDGIAVRTIRSCGDR